jgi:hypothetical protein
LKELLDRIEADLVKVKAWTKIDDPAFKAMGAQAWSGRGERWIFLVAGSSARSCESTATRMPPTGPGVSGFNDPSIVHLPQPLSGKAWTAASSGVGGS